MAEWVRQTQRETPKKISEGGDTVRSQCRLTDAGQTRSRHVETRAISLCRGGGTALPSAGETSSVLETVGGRGSLGGASLLGEDENKWTS